MDNFIFSCSLLVGSSELVRLILHIYTSDLRTLYTLQLLLTAFLLRIFNLFLKMSITIFFSRTICHAWDTLYKAITQRSNSNILLFVCQEAKSKNLNWSKILVVLILEPTECVSFVFCYGVPEVLKTYYGLCTLGSYVLQG